MSSASQFAWERVAADCGGHEYLPQPDKAGRSTIATGQRCWLCGGETGGAGWRQKELPPTFTNHNQAASPSSDTICQPCMAMSAKATWDAYVAAHPEMGLKTGKPISWRNYSHLFSEAGHQCPQREQWRRLLVDPPEPPFLAVMAISGQKHLIFRAKVAHDRDIYPLMVEEDLIWVRRLAMAECIDLVEEGMANGLPRADIETGHYGQNGIRRAGISAWRSFEDRMAPVRAAIGPIHMMVAARVARKEDP